MRWNDFFIFKLQQWLHCCWSLGINKQFHPTIYNGYTYLSMLRLKLNPVSKRCLWCIIFQHSIVCFPNTLLYVYSTYCMLSQPTVYFLNPSYVFSSSVCFLSTVFYVLSSQYCMFSQHSNLCFPNLPSIVSAYCMFSQLLYVFSAQSCVFYFSA